jgi:hypothetical protein
MANQLTNKINILAELWMNYREDYELEDFMEYNDLGLPLAYLLASEIVLPTPQAELYINETYDLLVAYFTVEDREWKSLDEMMNNQQQ